MNTSKLPPGFRFQPTDEEIVFRYLAPKIFSRPLPSAIIPEIDNIFDYNPRDLPGDDGDKYLFTNRESDNRNVKRENRATHSGYWRAIGVDRQIRCSKRMPVVGIKRTLVFCSYEKSGTDDWFMYSYSISVPRNNQGCLIQIGKWDLCHVSAKRICSKPQVSGNNLIMTEESEGESSCDSDSDSSVISSCSSNNNQLC